MSSSTSRSPHSSEPFRVVLTRDTEESEHLVDVVIRSVDSVVGSFGHATRAVIPRSSLKPVQMIPLLRTGAAEAFGVTDEEVALASASHSAEPAHVSAVEAWLARIELDVTALECGAARPFSATEADRRLAAGETFTPIHNCCSGKHVAYLTIARHLGVDPTGYIERTHPVQQLVTASIEEFTGVDLGTASSGIDGCGIPTFAIPLDALALSMARLVDAGGLDEETVVAADRVIRSLSKNPFWMSGTDRREMQLCAAANEPLVVKTGAEGVFMAALPERGLGIALKTRDGATRAADLAIAAVLEYLDVIPSGHAVANVTNAAGTVVGAMQVHIP